MPQPSRKPLTSWKSLPVLVTGASGFIGTRLVERLGELGAWVHAVSSPRSFGRGTPSSDCRWSSVDLMDARAVNALVKESAPDVVYHLGAVVNLERSPEVARECLSVNVLGTLNVLEALRGHASTRLVYASTTEIYGDNPVPFREDQLPRPPSAYAVSKLCGEQLCRLAWQNYGLSASVARLTATYGPGQAQHRLVASLIRAGILRKPLEIGQALQERDWLYVDDAVEGLLSIAQCDQAVGEIVNLGSGVRVSHRGLAERIGKLIGADVPVKFEEAPRRIGESPVWSTDATRAREWFGWTPRFSIEEGLKETIRWHLEQLSQQIPA